MSLKLQAFVISWLWAGGKTDNAAIGNQRRRKQKKKIVNETHRKEELDIKRALKTKICDGDPKLSLSIYAGENMNDANTSVFIVIKEKCVESFPSHLQFSLQSETDFPEIPSEFRISWNCLSLSDHRHNPHLEKLYSSSSVIWSPAAAGPNVHET